MIIGEGVIEVEDGEHQTDELPEGDDERDREGSVFCSETIHREDTHVRQTHVN